MKQAKQAHKTTKIIGIFVLVAAIIGFYGFTQTNHASLEKEVHIQKPQEVITQIQKPVQPSNTSVLSSENERYMVKKGDSYFSIAKKFKPKNVNMEDYLTLIKNINLNDKLHVSQSILIPSDEDLKNVILPSIVMLFDYDDNSIVEHLKKAEGTKEFQSTNKRRLLGGKVGYSYKNQKFYPYRDIKGNYTIGYGHFISKKESVALKYRNGISSTEAHNLLLKDMKKTHEDFISLLQKRNAVNLTKEQQRVLFEMSFTLGIDKLNKFNGLWKSVEKQNNKKFKREIENSLWYRQLGDRSELLVSML